MIKALKNKYALSDQGAKDLLKGIIYSVLANISLMFPVILLAIVLNQLLAPVLGTNAPEISAIVYTVIGIVILAVVFIFHYCQYTATYLGTYDESARRRIGLAEKLRTLPLTFFHQRDLADLTSTIMGDCANFEHAFSHTVPQFFGAVISTGIVCIGLLIFNWQMGLALLWVAPISFAIVTPSFVISGAPYALSSTTFLPFGPSVTLTVFANLSTPAPSAALASEPYLISFAMIYSTFLFYSLIDI